MSVRRLFCHKEAREEAMYSTRVVVDIIDCLAHRNTAVRTTAEKLCDIGECVISLRRACY